MRKNLTTALIVLSIIISISPLLAQDYNVTLPQQCNGVTGGSETLVFPMTPVSASSDANLTILYEGDLDLTTEFLTFYDEDGTSLGTTNSVAQCTGIGTFTAVLPMASIINWASDGQIEFLADAESAVNSGLAACTNASSFCVTATLDYTVVTGPNDIGVVSIDSPTVFCPGMFDVYATIQNFGTNQVTSATINWSIDGALQTPVNFTGILDTINGSGTPTASILLGNFNFSTNNPYDVEAWTTIPNGVVDTVTANDSTQRILQSSLPPPTGITATAINAMQASFTWTGGSANSWLWANVVTGNPILSGGTPVSSASANVTGLIPQATYDFYVREVCPTGDTSTWAGPFTYTTPFFCPPNSFCFSSAGQTGATGPSQTQLNTEYSGTNLAGNVTSNNGIQEWIVPAGGVYRIAAYGAAGGTAIAPYNNAGGLGAKMEGDFVLSQGDLVKIIVGQKGEDGCGAGGGGGGTFVESAGTLIIAAGGGGGATSDNIGADATISMTGTNDFPGGTTPGGMNGLGGSTCNNGSANHGGAGGGYLGDGATSTSSDPGGGGFAFVNGGEGGVSDFVGGFGGGGGCTNCTVGGGGGGGYSGGAGGQQVNACTPGINRSGGGGGGSFNSGVNTADIAGINNDAGRVIITVLSTGAQNDIGVVSIDSPQVFCPGVQSVYANLLNYGQNQVTSATVNWAVDGALQSPVTFNGLLDTIGGSGNTNAQINLGTFNFATNNPYDVEVWTTNPNGVPDTVSQNDTSSRVIQSSLPPPTGINLVTVAGNQANIAWNGGSLSNSWLWVNVQAGNPISGVGTATTMQSALVTGLTGETDYDFYVREVCSTGDTSAWAGPFTYTTPFYCPPNAGCFLTGGQEGPTGPTQSQLNTVYGGTPLAGQVTSNNGIQEWTVPSSGIYRIQAYGAQGGGSATRPGGRGAHITGDFALFAGQQLNLVIGQTGLIASSPAGNRGGGGGTFVWDASNPSQPLIAAGGGGGTNASVTTAAFGLDGSDLTSGTQTAGAAGTPGTGGNGASPGGAGFLTDGTISATNGGSVAPQAAVNGAIGGDGYTATSHYGGFGGGGGGGGAPSTTLASGGGGGYSGGAGQTIPASAGGGGGGSFNGGFNPVNIAGVRAGAGLVIVERLTSGAPNDAGITGATPNNVQCSGDYDIELTVANFGTNQINNLTLNWEWNGVPQSPIQITSPLDTFGGSGVSSTVISLGTQTLVGSNTLKAWTSNPNGTQDTVNINDTLESIFNPQFISAEIQSFQGAEICGAGSITLNATFSGGTLIWYDDPTLTNQVNSGGTYTLNLTQSDTFYIRAENTSGCNSNVEIVIADVSTIPSVSFTRVINNCTVEFTSVVSSNTDSVFWNFGDGVGTSSQLNPTYVYTSAQTFLVGLTAFDGSCSNDTSIGVFVNCIDALNDANISDRVTLFPNPSSGEFQINIDGPEFKVIELLDLNGNTIFIEEGVFDTVKKLDFKDLASGKYILRLRGENGTAIKNLVIDK